MDEHDAIFRALADPHRRTLLDALHLRDGQTLTELCALLDMTRFGVMKHLALLEEAGLLVTRKVGREKLHYLNPVPIQEVYDRWVSKYARPWTQHITGLKYRLETPAMNPKPVHVFEIFIRTTPEQLWKALTDGSITEQYYYGTRIESTWEQGAPYAFSYPDGREMITGTVLEIDPPHKLVMTFQPLWGDDAGKPSQVTYEIQQTGAACKFTLTHDMLDRSLSVPEGVVTGWANIFSSLKSLLETGEALIIEG